MTSFYVAMLVLMGLWWLINVLTLLAFAADKRFAILGQWRTSEKSLLLLAALGGTVGAKLAQRWLRHKTRKQPFATLLNIIAVGHVLLFVLLSYFGLWVPLIEAVASELESLVTLKTGWGGSDFKPKRFGPGS